MTQIDSDIIAGNLLDENKIADKKQPGKSK